jgi:putative ABC transport system substrate-binding protein
VRIGALVPAAIISSEEGLRQALSELGYIEGKNLTIDRRRAGSNDALQSGAADLVRSRVDVIVAFGTTAARAALSATSTIPVVFISGDPVGTGLAASLARPGANGTGVSTLSSELVPKRLELLLQIAPRVRRVILLGNPSSALHAGVLREAQKASQTLSIHIITLNARNADELNAALRGVQRSAGDAFTVSPDFLFLVNKERIAAAVAKAKLPAIFPVRDYHDAGVLMSYGPGAREMGRQAATYVHKILKGAKPADLPIEQISKYELVIDLRVARELGLDVPQDLLLRADEVIR